MKKWFGYSILLCITAAIGYTTHSLFTPTKKPVRVYVDMVADLFHYGHVSFLSQAKQFGDELVVGIVADKDVQSYKRLPYMNLEERCKSVAGCKLVDEVIPHPPLRVTKEFIEKHNIDLVVHGDDFPQDQLQYYYGEAIEIGKFKTVPYTKGISTSDIIRRIEKRAAATA